jgi:glycosyltransferase involved in cell wall biosynthesis
MEKVEETLKNIDNAIEKIKNKENRIIFLSPDTKGTAVASVAYIYRQAITLKNAGYNVSILHEKNDYTKVGSWLGEEFDSIEHKSIENNDLTVGPQDIIVVPEIYANVFEQVQNLPIQKLLLVQSYDHLLDSFSPGKSWLDFDVTNCLTTNKTLSEMLKELVPYGQVDFIEPVIPNYFLPSEKPQMPIVAIHCKDQRKAAKIIKTFYLKYPLYRFISFKDMHGMTELDFANNLKECAVSVWIDDGSSFGTFPIESLKCNVPVIGKVPNIIPEWMNDDNGVWVYDENQIPDLIFNYIKNWMEDGLPENLLNVSDAIKDKYTTEIFEKATVDIYQIFLDRTLIKLNKIKETFNKTTQDNEN